MNEEDCQIGTLINNEDNTNEVLAQLMYENRRLKNELDFLNRNMLGYEENIDSLSSNLQEKEEVLRSAERKITSLSQAVEDKHDVNNHLEQELMQLRESNENLENMVRSQKSKERDLSEQIEVLLLSMKDLTEKHNKAEEENSELKIAIQSQSEDVITHASFISDLRCQVKLLEEEKVFLQEKLEFLINERHSNKKLSPSSLLLIHSNNSSPVQRRLDFSPKSDGSSVKNDCSVLSLKEEFLMVEVHEKDRRINQLEEKLCNTEKKLRELRGNAIKYFDEVLPLLDSNKDFQIVSPVIKVTFDKIIAELRGWADGQSGESNPLTEAPDSVKVKEAVINAQPVPNRIVESISIATQTDRLLLAKALEEFSPLQNVLDHKYGDVDMDLYRSYRKLSILPEEEDDETFKRIPSLKNAINSKSFSAKIPQSYKTHSADDILNFDKRSVNCPNSDKLISSCTNIILSGRENALNGHVRETELFQDSPGKTGNDYSLICDNKLSEISNFKSEERSIINRNESRLDTLDPLEALRQPHSFDSYLDPQQIQNTSLPRQISDPTQNAAFDPPLTRRGSYLKRPRSTCRPLRLPCESNGMKREERTSKVRFDLSNDSKPIDNINGSKGPMPPSNLKNHRKIERISRFTVERVDEDEFRKSIEESNKTANRKRPPLIHSVVYKKSVLHDMTVYDPEHSLGSPDGLTARLSVTGSPDSPSYETATENSPAGSFDMASYESNYLIADIYPCKRRKQSDSSSYSIESQDSMDGNDILVKSIRLHTNSEYITMKELDQESSTSSHLSVEMDIPYIDAEELPVIKPSPEVIKRSFSEGRGGLEDEEDKDLKSTPPKSPIIQSDSSETFVTACSDVTPTSDQPEMSLSPPKTSGLSKSPTVLKNLANFELYNTVSESLGLGKRGSQSIRTQIVEEEEEVSDVNGGSAKAEDDHEEEEEESTILKLTSSDVSEMSDTVTYVTVKSEPSNHLLSSDCDSDTYVTIQSDKSILERKFSDLSENSSSPYNTPPDTSSASFCTPPDTYSPILSRLAKHFGTSLEGDSPRTRSSSPYRTSEYNSRTEHPKYDTPPNASPFSSPPCSSPFAKNYGLFGQEHVEAESVTIYNIEDSNYPSERTELRERKELIMFDSPKLEFYETNDSIENLEAFLQTEEGVMEQVKTPVSDRSWRLSSLEDLQEEPERIDRKYSDADEGSAKESLSKANSLESPSGADSKVLEKRGKRHPPLSRQNSTEEYNFLEPHDSCLNLSEEISSPSTTPDTSNKTVIFKNKPLTISNTIDLEDDDFPISESEIQINFNGSETEIVEISIGESTNKRYDMYSCRSEPCIPSISSSTIARLPKQSSSMTDEDPNPGKSDGNAFPVPPEIIVSNLSSDSENDSDVPGGILIDFASNASERSEINMSDLNSVSGQSDQACSNSDPSDNLLSERSPEMQITDPEVSLSVSPDVSDNSSSSSAHVHEFEVEPSDRRTPPTDGDKLYVDVHADAIESNVGNLRVVDDDSQVCSSTCEASWFYESFASFFCMFVTSHVAVESFRRNPYIKIP